MDAMPSYPRPHELGPLADRRPRPLLPLSPIPRIDAPPPLPSPPRISLLDHAYALSTHLVPAAYPRTTPDLPCPNLAFAVNKEEYKASVEEVVQTIIGAREKQWSGDLGGEPSSTQLWCCVNRYVKRDVKLNNTGSVRGKPLTLFFAHANGFPKEIWEPALKDLIALNATSASPLDIQEIWCWEAVNHGDAALVNAGKLGGIYDWVDNTRDMLHFLLHYLPSSPYTPADALPTHLARVPDTVAHSRRQFGFQGRTFVATGHSFGGCTSYRAALEVPALFSSLVLVDPIIRPLRPGMPLILPSHQTRMTRDAVRRRGHWESRHEALKLFRTSPFFGSWRPDVLDVYINCGMTEDPKGGVSLKMSGMLEGIVFSEGLATYEAWNLAPKLDERITLKWIMPGQIPPEEEKMKQELVWRRTTNASNVVILSAGHLIPQEAPHELAKQLIQFLLHKYPALSTLARL